MTTLTATKTTEPLTRHYLSADGTHVFYAYNGNFTTAKSDDFGDKLLAWMRPNNPIVSRFVARTHAGTSDRWKNVEVEVPMFNQVAIISADGVEEIVVFKNKVVFL